MYLDEERTLQARSGRRGFCLGIQGSPSGFGRTCEDEYKNNVYLFNYVSNNRKLLFKDITGVNSLCFKKMYCCLRPVTAIRSYSNTVPRVRAGTRCSHSVLENKCARERARISSSHISASV